MAQVKLRVSIPDTIARFVHEYRARHDLPTKSAVVVRALEFLEEREIEDAYAAAATAEAEAWDATLADGLAPDDW